MNTVQHKYWKNIQTWGREGLMVGDAEGILLGVIQEPDGMVNPSPRPLSEAEIARLLTLPGVQLVTLEIPAEAVETPEPEIPLEAVETPEEEADELEPEAEVVPARPTLDELNRVLTERQLREHLAGVTHYAPTPVEEPPKPQLPRGLLKKAIPDVLAALDGITDRETLQALAAQEQQRPHPRARVLEALLERLEGI